MINTAVLESSRFKSGRGSARAFKTRASCRHTLLIVAFEVVAETQDTSGTCSVPL